MPVLNLRPVVASSGDENPLRGDDGNSNYECPVYMTRQRGASYVFTASLRTKQPPAKWVLAGVALLMDDKAPMG
jgi:dynein heavy chain